MVVKWNQVHRLGYTKQQTFAGAHCIIVQCTCFWCCLYLVYFQPIVAAFEIPPLRRISSPAPSFILRSVNVTLALVQFIFSCFMIVIFYLFGMLLSSNLPTFILFPPNFSSFGALLWFLSQFSSEFFFFHVHKPHMKKNIPRYIEASKKKMKNAMKTTLIHIWNRLPYNGWIGCICSLSQFIQFSLSLFFFSAFCTIRQAHYFLLLCILLESSF